MPIIHTPNGCKVNLVRTGPKGGAPVVLLHAMGLDLTYWDRQIAGLCDAFDLIAFDFPGHGPAGTIPEEFSFGSVCRLLDGVIEHAGGGPAHLVGLSLGGQVAMAFALDHPEKVRSLSLINTACRVPAAARAKMEEKGSLARQEGMSVLLAGALASWFTPVFQGQRPDLMDRIAKTLLLPGPGREREPVGAGGGFRRARPPCRDHLSDPGGHRREGCEHARGHGAGDRRGDPRGNLPVDPQGRALHAH